MKMLGKKIRRIFNCCKKKTAQATQTNHPTLEAKATQTDPSTQDFLMFLEEMLLEKREAIKELEIELECPVCFEIVEGEIYSCVLQHFVCFQCRQLLVECPQCREPYPPDLIRHRYVEKRVDHLERLREEVGRILQVLEQ